MDRKTVGQTVAAIAFGTLLAQGATARAHIDIDMGGTHDGRSGDIKVGPCGGQPRGTAVHTYKPGETITLSIIETIPHPGYFRVAFDDDGEDGFLEPAMTEGTGGNCVGDANCGPGKTDYCNSGSVLLDNLDQHASAAQNTKRTWSVTLPNVECDNCTLQVIQIMNDLLVHPGAFPIGDIYHGCIDLVLSNSAPDVNDAPVTNNGMVCTWSGGAGGTGGVGGTGGTGGNAGVGGNGGVGGEVTGGTGGAAGAGGTGGLIGGMGGAAGMAGMAGAAGAGAIGGAAGAAGFAPPAGAGGSTTTETSGCSVGGGRDASGTAFGVLLGLAALYRSRRRGISSTKLQG